MKKFTLPLILLVALVLRLGGLHQSFWLDEGTEVLAVSTRGLVDLVTSYSLGDFHPPLYHVILWMWTKLFPLIEWSVRLPSVFFSLGIIAIIFHFGNSIRRPVGTIAALFLAVNGLDMYYSQEARMYMMAAFGATLAMWCFWRNLAAPRFMLWLGYTVGMMIALGADYLPWFLLLVQWAWIWFTKPSRNWIKPFVVTQAVLFACIVAWAPFFWKQFAVGQSIAHAVPAWGEVVGGVSWTSLPLLLMKFILGRLPIPDSNIERLMVGGLVIPFLVVLGLTVLRRQKTTSFFWLWFLVPIVISFGISFFIPVFSYFRFLFVLPAFVLLMSFGLLQVEGRLRWMIGAFFVAICATASVVYLTNQNFWREDWRSAAVYLDNKDVFVLFATPQPPDPYTFYSTKDNAKGLVQINGGDFPERLRFIIGDNDEILVSNYLQDISDPVRRLQSELHILGFSKTITKQFRGIGEFTTYVRGVSK
ncbi:MAG: glycosyltransferase family 39 protein [bacterium]|nr:glycosyltransferase family 39 protein [bacterium]